MRNITSIISRVIVILIISICTSTLRSQVNEEWVLRSATPITATVIDSSGNIYSTGTRDGKCTTIKYNSEGIEQWVVSYTGISSYYSTGVSIKLDNSDNIYVGGSDIFYDGTGYRVDFLILKYNPHGIQEWVAKYTGPVNHLDDDAISLAIDNSGNVYITGYRTGPETGLDYATVKYNSEGLQMWVAKYNGPGNNDDKVKSIAIDGSGNIIVSGSSDNNDETGFDFATIKYNSKGEQLWAARYNGSANDDDKVCSMAADISGNVYVSGTCISNGYPHYKYATVKYNNSGIEQWVKEYSYYAGSAFAKSMTIDNSGNIYVTGINLSWGENDVWATVKYNSDGIQQWAAAFVAIGDYNDPTAIVTDPSGNIYVTGMSGLSRYTTTWDIATIKYNPDGALQWYKIFNGTGNSQDGGTGINADASGNAYVIGISRSNVPSWEYVLIKYSPDDPLPVELTSFNSVIISGNVILKWTTATETNNSGFDVERSNVKGQTSNEWKKISFVQGHGTINSPNNYEFTDKNLSPGKYNYRLKQIDFNGNYEYHNLNDEVVIGVPEKFELSQNYPNPFNPSTVIRYSLSENSFVSLKVYDVTGNEVATLVNEKQNGGTYNYQFSTVNYQLSSGVYFYKIEAGSFSAVKRMILIK